MSLSKSSISARAAVLLGALAVTALSATSALAATVTTNYSGLRPNALAVRIAFNNTRDSAPGTQNYHVYAGQMNWSNSVGNGFSVPSSFFTYCIEFTQNVKTSGSTTYTVENLADAPKPFGNPPGNPSAGMGVENGLGTTRKKDTLIRQLWNNFSTAAAATNTASAAFQLAIWKIIYEDSTSANAFTNITVGNLRYTESDANLISTANSYLSWLTNAANANASQAGGLVAFTNSQFQDQIFNDTSGGNPPSFGATPIPLPASVAMGGSLFAFMLVRRGRA